MAVASHFRVHLAQFGRRLLEIKNGTAAGLLENDGRGLDELGTLNQEGVPSVPWEVCVCVDVCGYVNI